MSALHNKNFASTVVSSVRAILSTAGGAWCPMMLAGTSVLFMPLAGSAQTLSSSVPSAGSTNDAKSLEEIVVTATRRESTVQQTAGSISAISGDQIASRGVTDFLSLVSSVPGVSFTTSGPGQTEYELRGLSSPGGNSPTVGFYLDDTPLTAAASSNSGKVVIDPNLYDISRVEILRGPQGTLFGSGSMGGTIRIITNQPNPEAFAASSEVKMSGTEGGGFNHTESGMLNLPLAQDIAALRVVATQQSTSGWTSRIVVAPGTFPNPVGPTGSSRGDVQAAPVANDFRGVNNTEETSVRASILVRPLENLSVTPSVIYQHVQQGGPNAFDSSPGTLAVYQPYDIAEPYDERFVLGSLNIQYHLPGIDLSSNTADYKREQTQTQDGTEEIAYALGLPNVYAEGATPFHAYDETGQFSEELRAASSGDTAFKWLVGLFYSDLLSIGANHSADDPGAIPIFGSANLFTRTQPYTIVQEALFSELSFQFTPQLKVTEGFRAYHYRTSVTTYSDGDLGPTGNDTLTTTIAQAAASGVSPKYDIAYTPTEDLTVYGTIAKGFRPGGGNQPIVTAGSAEGTQCAAALAGLGLTKAPLQFGPDSVWSYEIGEKARFFNRRLSVNLSAYAIDWTGIQQGVDLTCGYSFSTNAGAAKIYGSEFELKALLTQRLEFSANAGYIHARISQGSTAAGTVTGDPLQTVPTWTNNVGLTYTRPLTDDLSLTAHIENGHVGKRDDFAYLALTPTPAYDLTNLRAGITKGPLSATVFVDNVLNKRAILAYVQAQAIATPQLNDAVSSQPLTAGIDLNYRF
jgi:iron complex outermembrane receptor protein